MAVPAGLQTLGVDQHRAGGLLSGLQRGKVIADYLAFIHDPAAALPNGEPESPFR
ncbi:MAG: hypothetical protein Q8L84_11745 [Hyphomonas sp.]|nr:hypothetical protein [Hyphomonas sp.]